MRNIFKSFSVSLAVLAVVYGLFLKYEDKKAEVSILPVVELPTVVEIEDDSVYFDEFDYSTEDPY